MIVRAALATVLAVAIIAPAPQRVRVDGRFFVLAGKTFRPLFASMLALLVRPAGERARVLDEVKALGFNGIRVFAGALEWAGQTPQQAVSVLPAVLEEARRRGLQVEVTAITDSTAGYDVESHLRAVARSCAAAPNCLLEAANEYYHPTQAPMVQDGQRLFAIATSVMAGAERPAWALGAPSFDVLQQGRLPAPSGDYITVHLDRGGTPTEQLARLREVARVSEATGKPVLNNEPIGAAERAQPGRRASSADFFFALGALSRLFELGAVFHSEDGLHARPLGRRQREAARAFVAGFRAIDTDARLTVEDAGGERGPVHSGSAARPVFTARGARAAWAVQLDPPDDARLQWRGRWSAARVVARRPGLLLERAAIR